MKQADRWAGWRRLATAAGFASLAVIGITAVALRDPDAALTSVGLAVSLVLLRFRRGLLGLIGLTILFTDIAFWSVTGATVNLAHGSGFFGSALESVLAVIAVAGLVAVIGAFATFKAPRGERAARIVRSAAIAFVIVALAASFATSLGNHSEAKKGDIQLVARHVKFAPSRIEVRAGRVGVDFSNKDFFWHTFTVRKLHVSLNVPTRGESRLSFRAPPGTYEFVCLIHEQVGMKGELIVR